jgi:hypothetical protein
MCRAVQDGIICPGCNYIELIGKQRYMFCPKNYGFNEISAITCGIEDHEKTNETENRFIKKLCWTCERENGPTQQQVREPPPYTKRA